MSVMYLCACVFVCDIIIKYMYSSLIQYISLLTCILNPTKLRYSATVLPPVPYSPCNTHLFLEVQYVTEIY